MSVIKLVCLTLLLLIVQASYGAVVLEYHHVSNSTPKSTSISPEKFNQHMDYLQANNFNVVPLTDLVELLRKGKPVPDKTIAITFDDAYASVYQSAYPLLKRRGWPFTFFVNTHAINSSPLFVSWQQLRDMAANGVTIANHSQYHQHMPRLKDGETLSQWRERTSKEIQEAQKILEKEIGVTTKIFAYPFGEYNAELQDILKQLGYVAFGQQSGPLAAESDLQALPRFPFGGSFTELDDFAMKVNTLPMPIVTAEFYSDKNTPMADLVVRQGAKPYLVLTLSDKTLLGKIKCFASGQTAINTEVVGDKLWVHAKQPLKPGRMRYNCTAPSKEKNRFYWYTQQWLVTDVAGTWTYND